MKFLQQLMEMAKGKNKRKREAKRARKNKAEKPTMDAQSNPVAKFAQQTGAGLHNAGGEGKYSKGKIQRAEGKKQIKQELDN